MSCPCVYKASDGGELYHDLRTIGFRFGAELFYACRTYHIDIVRTCLTCLSHILP